MPPGSWQSVDHRWRWSAASARLIPLHDFSATLQLYQCILDAYHRTIVHENPDRLNTTNSDDQGVSNDFRGDSKHQQQQTILDAKNSPIPMAERFMLIMLPKHVVAETHHGNGRR
jgi:hypothetical protein